MNFPDLETCRAIASEFPNSEFVLVDRDERTHEDAPGEVFLRVFGGGPLAIAWRSKTNCKIIASAPICEELGEWLSHHYSKALLTETKEYLVKIQKLFFSCVMSEQETQARAEAVALALKENQK